MKFMEKIKLAMPREKNYAAWLVKNSKTVFSKLTRKISLSVLGEQASQHLTSSFPFSDFYILSRLLGCYFSGKFCAFHFGQMFNGFSTSTFEFYWGLALQLSCITVKLSESKYLFPEAGDEFIKKWTSAVFYVHQLAHPLVCLVC